jgi:hypothetical protein
MFSASPESGHVRRELEIEVTRDFRWHLFRQRKPQQGLRASVCKGVSFSSAKEIRIVVEMELEARANAER